jgi:4-aminobutyrate aminotransferase-like enzyme
MTMAKGIANGFPLSNTITTPEIAQGMVGKGLTISTFGGNPVAAAASLATVEVMQEEDLPGQVAQVGEHMRAGLERLQTRYPLIGDVRGKGLMLGVELVKDRQTKEPAPQETNALMEEARRRGLLIGKGGIFGTALRLGPPLTATIDHAEEALHILDHAFAAVQEGAM